MRIESLGGLTVRITGGEDHVGGGDGPVVVLMHGFGAPGGDLVTLARVMDVPRSTRFAFPEAPLSVPGSGGGRAWWMIDTERFAPPLGCRAGPWPGRTTRNAAKRTGVGAAR